VSARKLILALATTVTMASSLFSPAAAGSTQTLFMPAGTATAAPAGFLRFCARLPAQCGLGALGDLQPGPDQAAVSRALAARYYWPLLFQPAPAPLALTAAAAGDSRDLGRQSAQSPDWSRIFGVSPAALGLAQAADARRTSGGQAPVRPDDAFLLAAAVEETAQPVTPLPADAALMARLTEVTRRVNRAIRYVPEQRVSGDADTWRLPLSSGERAVGDCKDYVLEKRRALIQAGVAPSNLSIAIVRTPRGETHAVLLVITDRGELVLDSLSDWVRPWRQVRYTWLARQGLGRQLGWVSLRNAGGI
jgi:predicted transglutaminase-like cysteine proteinase